MNRSVRAGVLAVAVAACSAGMAWGQATGAAGAAKAEAAPRQAVPAPGAQEEAVVRVYNVSDLVSTARNYPYRSSIVPPTRVGGGEGGGDAEETEYSVGVRKPGKDGKGVTAGGEDGKRAGGGGVGIEQLRGLIMGTVAPDSWRDNGGTVGAMVQFGPGLVVTQTAANHRQIEGLLNELRSEVGLSARTVSVRLSWLMVAPGELEKYLRPRKGDGPPEVNWEAVEGARGVLKYDARVTCYSGQTVSIASGRGRTVVTGMQPVVGQSAAMYGFETSLVQSGVVVELTPQLTKEDAATLDVRAVASELAPPATQPAGGRAAGEAGVDRVDALAQQLSTTVRLPVNVPVLIGGMTLEPVPEHEEMPQLYLVAEVRP